MVVTLRPRKDVNQISQIERISKVSREKKKKTSNGKTIKDKSSEYLNHSNNSVTLKPLEKKVVRLPIFTSEKSTIPWTSNSAGDHLKNNWTNPTSPISFLGISRIYNFYKKKNFKG